MSRRFKIVMAVVVTIIVMVGVGLFVASRQLEPRLHAWLVESLGRSLQSQVTLGRVKLAWYPLKITALDLTVRHHGRTDIPPLIVVSSFTVDLKFMELLGSTVEHVKVDGMEIYIPPKDDATGKRPIPRPQKDGQNNEPSGSEPDRARFLIKRLTATNTRLAIIPKTSGKNPKVWDIFQLEMDDLGGGAPSLFRAALTNPIPYGVIEAAGRFGPWDADAPGASGLEGEYTFAADLSTIKGLQGQVNAIGTMGGVLEEIATSGETRTPDFRLTSLDGVSMPLTTTYDALVDGTKGDVELKRVDLMLGTSPLRARGMIQGKQGLKGKRVVLNITSQGANVAEILQLASKTQPPMARGLVTIDAALDLPQGEADLMDRVQVEGSVKASRLRFADEAVQEKIDTLSRRGQGRPSDVSIDDVASNLTGRFTLKDKMLTYRHLAFSVTGAAIKLDGTHHLKTKALALQGEVLLKASASNTLTGVKRWLLKPLNPLFRKNGAGTRLVIRVEGTQDQPKVALEIGKTLRGR